MEIVDRVLRALANRAHHTRQLAHAERVAQRARGKLPARTETHSFALMAELCLIDAVKAADLPANHSVDTASLSPHPVAAAQQLIFLAGRHDGRAVVDLEPARLAYRADYVTPVTADEQRCVDHLAAMSAARRDKVTDLAERQARQHDSDDGPPV